MNDQTQSKGAVQLRIIRGSVDSLSLYEITDYELEIFEEGSPSTTFLNFAIMFMSIGLSFFATLLTVNIPAGYVFTIFLVLSVVGIGSSAVLFVLWWRMRSRTKDLCSKIRARVPTTPISEPVDTSPPTDGANESDS